MAVCRVEKNKNYTTMSNYHLRDPNLSNKARGLLSTMLSLPDNWDYTTRGFAKICKDGVDGITAQLKELEQYGYLIRHRIRDTGGRIVDIEETPTGIRLKKYMEEYFDPRIYIAGELGIGLNSCSNCLGNCYIEDESAYGTFHVGLGRNIALGGVQNAKGHFDLVCREPDIFTDNRQIMDRGKIIAPEPVLY